MGPELHLQMIAQRAIEFRQEADDYRRARKARGEGKSHSHDKRRRTLFGKIISA